MSAVAEARVLPTYARADITFTRGQGCWLEADDGTRYLDFLAGIAVVGLGHCHPAVSAAAHGQLDRLWHVSNLYWTEPMLELAERLFDCPAVAPLDRRALAIGDANRQVRGRDQAARGTRPLGGDDERIMPGGNEGLIKRR